MERLMPARLHSYLHKITPWTVVQYETPWTVVQYEMQLKVILLETHH